MERETGREGLEGGTKDWERKEERKEGGSSRKQERKSVV